MSGKKDEMPSCNFRSATCMTLNTAIGATVAQAAKTEIAFTRRSNRSAKERSAEPAFNASSSLFRRRSSQRKNSLCDSAPAWPKALAFVPSLVFLNQLIKPLVAIGATEFLVWRVPFPLCTRLNRARRRLEHWTVLHWLSLTKNRCNTLNACPKVHLQVSGCFA